MFPTAIIFSTLRGSSERFRFLLFLLPFRNRYVWEKLNRVGLQEIKYDLKNFETAKLWASKPWAINQILFFFTYKFSFLTIRLKTHNFRKDEHFSFNIKANRIFNKNDLLGELSSQMFTLHNEKENVPSLAELSLSFVLCLG